MEGQAVEDWPFRVVPIPGKGLGAVASRDIALGERVLADAPLLVLRFDEFSEERAQAAVQALSGEEQAAFFALGCQATTLYGSDRTPLNILQNNCLPLGPVSEASEAAMFPNAARFNHSCTPNVHHSWNANIKRETMHACRPIQAGEELCTSYIQVDQSREHRQKHLTHHFGFACTCSACELQGEALAESNARRSRINWLEEQVAGAKSFSAALQHVEDRVQLLRLEGLADPCMLRYAEHDAFQVCKLAGKHKDARKWLRSAHEHSVQAEGADSPICQRYERLLALPLKAPLEACQ